MPASHQDTLEAANGVVQFRSRANELPPIFTSENVPEVIAAYQREFPGRRIVIVPSENVNFDDKMPRAPRKAA